MKKYIKMNTLFTAINLVKDELGINERENIDYYEDKAGKLMNEIRDLGGIGAANCGDFIRPLYVDDVLSGGRYLHSYDITLGALPSLLSGERMDVQLRVVQLLSEGVMEISRREQ